MYKMFRNVLTIICFVPHLHMRYTKHSPSHSCRRAMSFIKFAGVLKSNSLTRASTRFTNIHWSLRYRLAQELILFKILALAKVVIQLL